MKFYFNTKKLRNAIGNKKKYFLIFNPQRVRIFLKRIQLKNYLIKNFDVLAIKLKNKYHLQKDKFFIEKNLKNGIEINLIKSKKKFLYIYKKFRVKSADLILFLRIKVDRFVSTETKNQSDFNLLPPPPIWSRIMIWTIGSGSIFVLTWSIFTKVEETVMLQGELTTDRSTVSISTKDQGVLSSILIKPHQEINEGQVLLKFKDDETYLRIDSLKKRLSYLKSQTEKDKNTFDLKIKQTNEQLKLDELLLDKYMLLALEGAISKIQYQEKRTEFINLSTSLETLLVEAQSTQLLNQEKMEQIQNSINELVAKSQRFSIVSPTDGYIQEIRYQTPGERIQPGEVIVTIIPKGELIARIKIPSNLSAPIKISYPATLDIDAYPSSDFGMVNAEVTSVSPMSGPANRDSPQRIFTADLKILSSVSPDLLDLNDLLPGMAVTARLRLREKPIITTVFDILSDVFDPLSEKK